MSEDKYYYKTRHRDGKKNSRIYKAFSNSNAEMRSKIPSELISRLKTLVST